MIVKKSADFNLEEFGLLESSAFSNRKSGSILELRKEKSRDAARSRRGKENYEFYELAKLLPLPAAITSQLDKASIIRLTISALKLRSFSAQGDPQWTKDGFQDVSSVSQSQPRNNILDSFESRQGTHILQSLDGFAFLLANDGRFLYISETVSIYLGLSQVEMAGSSIFEYVHHQDHAELADQLGMSLMTIGSNRSPQGSCSDDASSSATPRPVSPSDKGYVMVPGQDKNAHKSFCLRMKSTLTKRGAHVKSSGYRVLHITGRIRCPSSIGINHIGCQNSNSDSSSIISEPQLLGFVGMAIALPPPTINELRLELDTFITRMTPDLKVIYCEPIISDFMDLTAEDVNNRLIYDLCHPADLQKLRRSHLDLLNKGQALTDYYRLLNRHGGHVCVQTCATTMLNNKNSDDQNILAINFVVSSSENKHCAMDLWQVTGDVTSLMSSTSSSTCREEKLKELRSNNNPRMAASKSRFPSSTFSYTKHISSSPNESPHDTHGQRNTDRGSPNEPSVIHGENVDRASPATTMGNTDSINKRRKMGNPRKRRRTNSDPQELNDAGTALNLTRNDIRTSILAKIPLMSPQVAQCEGTIMDYNPIAATNRWSMDTNNISSASPEDLSIKGTTRQSPNKNIFQYSASVHVDPASPNSSKYRTKSPLEDNNSTSPLSMTRNTVKELEVAMSRHLPESASQTERNIFSSSLIDETKVLREFPRPANSKNASNHIHASSSWHSSSLIPNKMAASTFLHNLYTNRESVIKTNSRSQAPQFNMEPPASLLTPPEPDHIAYRPHNIHYSQGKQDSLDQEHVIEKDIGFEAREMPYRDQYSFLPYKDHIPTSYLDHIPSSVYKDQLASTYKELSAYRDIPSFSIPNLLSPTGRIHQAYKSFHHHFNMPTTSICPPLSDACSMTPPSPNSPDMSKHYADTSQFDLAIYASELNNTCGLSQKHEIINCSLQPSALPSTHHYDISRHQKETKNVRSGDPSRGSYYGVPSPTKSFVHMNSNHINTGSRTYESYTRPTLPWY